MCTQNTAMLTFHHFRTDVFRAQTVWCSKNQISTHMTSFVQPDARVPSFCVLLVDELTLSVHRGLRVQAFSSCCGQSKRLQAPKALGRFPLRINNLKTWDLNRDEQSDVSAIMISCTSASLEWVDSLLTYLEICIVYTLSSSYGF